MKLTHGLLLAALFLPAACMNRPAAEETAGAVVKTPVTVTGMERGTIEETISMNATSAYLRKNEIRSNTSGYVDRVSIQIGDLVTPGSPLFLLKTREAEALGNLSGKDTLLRINGVLPINAAVPGIITAVNVQPSTYVNEGDVLAMMADRNSFAFILHVPFEFRNYTQIGTVCRILLPDSTSVEGKISSKLSEVDPASQTESYLVKVNTARLLPENLIATVTVSKRTSRDAQILDKSCVLSDETMENFWVMHLVGDSLAVKVPIRPGIMEGERIEIVSPVFDPGDRFIRTGNYGLPDTARIVINK
jgi:hypothetical protein